MRVGRARVDWGVFVEEKVALEQGEGEGKSKAWRRGFETMSGKRDVDVYVPPLPHFPDLKVCVGVKIIRRDAP